MFKNKIYNRLDYYTEAKTHSLRVAFLWEKIFGTALNVKIKCILSINSVFRLNKRK